MIDKEEYPDEDDYLDAGFTLLMIVTIVIGAVVLAGYLTIEHPKEVGSVIAVIVGLGLVVMLFYYICYGLGYLYYELPERIEQWK